MYYLKDYREGQKLVGTYLCKTKQVLKTKAGKTYYSLTLQDKTAIVDAKIWDLNNGIASFEALAYVYCEGLVTTFQGNIQMNISRLRQSEEGEYDPADYIPATTKDVEQMFGEIISYVNSVKNPFLNQLLTSFFVEDESFIREFKKHSAAKSVHHGFLGGLLEHTLSVTNMCDFFCKSYPRLHRDLLITAALFHDMGKMDEIASFPRNDYTDAGQLLGHIYIGAQKLTAAISRIEGFPKKMEHELIHCILAHHGKLEFGSPKVPALMEAMALHLADNADAKLQTLTEVFNQAGSNMEWLGFDRRFESNLRQTSGDAYGV